MFIAQRRVAFASGLLAAVALAACSGGASSTSDVSDTVAPATTVESTTTTTIPPILAPLTGLPVSTLITRPALVVKIDNHPKARPQWVEPSRCGV